VSAPATRIQYAVLACPGCDNEWADDIPTLDFPEELLDQMLEGAGLPQRAFEEIPELRAMKDAAMFRTLRKPEGWPTCPDCNRRGRLRYLLAPVED
jgi:hypothetical protein